jgi:serine/threonine protein kinase
LLAFITVTPEPAKLSSPSATLRKALCGGCGKTVFIASELQPLETTPCGSCGHEVMMPLMLRQFELRAPIASGGMGTVYRSWDTKLDREVAVKLMRKDIAGDLAMLEAFAREARACARLNHTNIIHIYTFDEWDGRPYLVMELADQGSLDGRIEQEQRLPELHVLDIGIKIADALNTALKHNLLHRDIKPGNILFNADGEPKLVDFGLATHADTDSGFDSEIFGTPYYVAPERIMRQKEDFRADLYSLGGTLYHALTGHVPFEAPTPEEVVSGHVHTPLTPPRQVVPEVTEMTSDALARSMAKDPNERFASYDEFKMTLEAARSNLLVQSLAAQPAEEEAKPAKNGKSWWRFS